MSSVVKKLLRAAEKRGLIIICGQHNLEIVKPAARIGSIENSPELQLWVQDVEMNRVPEGRQEASFVPDGTLALSENPNPALKRWAIFKRQISHRGTENTEAKKFFLCALCASVAKNSGGRRKKGA